MPDAILWLYILRKITRVHHTYGNCSAKNSQSRELFYMCGTCERIGSCVEVKLNVRTVNAGAKGDP